MSENGSSFKEWRVINCIFVEALAQSSVVQSFKHQFV